MTKARVERAASAGRQVQRALSAESKRLAQARVAAVVHALLAEVKPLFHAFPRSEDGTVRWSMDEARRRGVLQQLGPLVGQAQRLLAHELGDSVKQARRVAFLAGINATAVTLEHLGQPAGKASDPVRVAAQPVVRIVQGVEVEIGPAPTLRETSYFVTCPRVPAGGDGHPGACAGSGGDGPGGVSDDERKAVSAYQGAAYGTINDHLRGKAVTSAAQRQWVDGIVSHIDHAIDRSRLSEPTTVYRGAQHPGLTLAKAKGMVGRSAMDAAFLSTTSSLSAAKEYAPGDHGVIFEIHLPKGHAALDVAASNLPGGIFDAEHERLLPRNTDLRITGVSKRNDGRLHFTMEPSKRRESEGPSLRFDGHGALREVLAERFDITPAQLLPGEPAEPTPDRRRVARVVVREDDGTLWLVDEADEHGEDGARRVMFPGGGVEDGESLQAAAVREAWEETGLVVQLTGYLADFVDAHAYRRYYVARRVAGEATEIDRDGDRPVRVRRVGADEARGLLGSPYDVAALAISTPH